MSETYTEGGDTWQPLTGFNISGQTFTPLESHTLAYVDLNLWMFSGTPPPLVISECDADHNPIDPVLSYARPLPRQVFLPPHQIRVRYRLQTPFYALRGHIYAIRARKDPADLGPDNSMFYDKDDATYPRGHIIYSSDGGTTWDHFPNSDFIFCEFGLPPLPKTEPPPPVENFAMTGIDYFHNPTSVTITFPTSVPCHLTCYYTDIEPKKHHTSALVRGLEVPWDTYFCFVAWKSVEQQEEGDSLYHTFEVPDWIFCEKRWFTFRGTVDNILSPSVGPIFVHHHDGVLPFHNLSFNIYPVTPGIPTSWLPHSLGPGEAGYLRNEVDVLDPPYSAQIIAVGLDFITGLSQYRWNTGYENKTVRCTFHWFGGGRGALWWCGRYSAFSYGSGWHTISHTVTFGPNPYLASIGIRSGGRRSSFTALSWDNITLTIL